MNRNTLIARLTKLGQELVKNTVQRENLRWSIAEKASALKATYPAGGEKAFLAAAATATGLTEGDIGNLVRAFEVRGELTPAQVKQTENWTTDAALVLRGKGMTPANRNKVIAKAEKANTQNVKKLRAFKSEVVTPKSRQKQNATDRKIALSKKLSKDIARLFKNHPGAVMTLAAGARFAQDNPGEDIAAVLIFAAAQVRKATPVAS